MGRLDAIWIKRALGGRMDAAERSTLVAGSGLHGNANQGGRRQVTLLSREVWDAFAQQLGHDLPTSARRANLVLSGVDLRETRERVLAIGPARIRILGETKPCHQMEETFPGLEAALWPDWGGGAFGEVVEGGEIGVGDAVRWVEGDGEHGRAADGGVARANGVAAVATKHAAR